MTTSPVDADARTLAELARDLLDHPSVAAVLAIARAEDVGDPVRGDVTTESVIDAGHRTRAAITAREAGIAAGLALVPRVIEVFESSVRFDPVRSDGDRIAVGDVLARLEGPTGEILLIERTVLNIVGHASGIASRTAEYVDAIEGTGAVVCETRKTLPGLRRLQKYAVRCGGGHLHRFGLHDAALYKDNHLAALPPGPLDETLGPALARARTGGDLRFVEVEVDTLEQFDELLRLPEDAVDIVLLDNMDPATMREAVTRRDATRPRWQLEASGGITLDTIRTKAESGVDRISVGALTHSVRNLDVGLDAESEISP